MSQLTTEQLVKIIIGIFVFVAVIVGIYLFFRYNVISFFKGYTDEENPVIQPGETGTPAGSGGTGTPWRGGCRGGTGPGEGA